MSEREKIAASIIKGRTMHGLALTLIEEMREVTKSWKFCAAARLAFLFAIDFDDATAIVSEMAA